MSNKKKIRKFQKKLEALSFRKKYSVKTFLFYKQNAVFTFEIPNPRDEILANKLKKALLLPNDIKDKNGKVIFPSS